jgi:ABC-type molybdate transport system permease subunit
LISNFTQVIIGAVAVRQLLPLLVRQSASAGCAAAIGRAAAEAAKAEGKKKRRRRVRMTLASPSFVVFRVSRFIST